MKHCRWIKVCMAAAFLLFAFMSSACALLAYGVVAHKSNQSYELLNNSPFYLGGFAQGFETLLALVLMCILPGWFLQIAIIGEYVSDKSGNFFLYSSQNILTSVIPHCLPVSEFTPVFFI